MTKPKDPRFATQPRHTIFLMFEVKLRISSADFVLEVFERRCYTSAASGLHQTQTQRKMAEPLIPETYLLTMFSV